MKIVQFKDVKEDEVFVWNGTEYKKTAEKRVSCCKAINCVMVENSKVRLQVTPLTEVQVND